MPAHRKLPPINDIMRLMEQGHTHGEIAEICSAMTGERITRGAVTSAINRADKSTTTRVRHDDTIPWKVKARHTTEYQPRMLRCLGRRLKGLPNKPGDDDRLDSWLAWMERERRVVGYYPDAEDDYGFHCIPASAGTPGRVAPIRVPVLTRAEYLRWARNSPTEPTE